MDAYSALKKASTSWWMWLIYCWRMRKASVSVLDQLDQCGRELSELRSSHNLSKTGNLALVKFIQARHGKALPDFPKFTRVEQSMDS